MKGGRGERVVPAAAAQMAPTTGQGLVVVEEMEDGLHRSSETDNATRPLVVRREGVARERGRRSMLAQARVENIEEEAMGEVDILRRGLGKIPELAPMSLRVGGAGAS